MKDNFNFNDFFKMDSMLMKNNVMPFPHDNMDFNINNNLDLFNSVEGYTLGNIFKKLYQPYMGMNPRKLQPKNQQEQALFNLNQLSFFAHELNLYLDVYPEDTKALELFNRFRELENEARDNYEQQYGPLNISSNALLAFPFLWVTQDFPWEGYNV